MQPIVEYPTRERQTPTEPTATVSRLRTVTGNRFPYYSACGCGFGIPGDPGVRTQVDFGAARHKSLRVGGPVGCYGGVGRGTHFVPIQLS